jgi:hypothetical protein
MFGIELGVPFLIFAPRRLRQMSCVALVAFQVCILLTGNYCFFNLLTLALCLLLLDDAAVRNLVPQRWRAFLLPDSPPGHHDLLSSLRKRSNWRLLLAIPLTCTVLATSLVQFALLFQSDSERAGGREAAPRPLLAFSQWFSPLRTFNRYGLFAVMTTSRPEIIIEGSNDGAAWLAYEFKYKPGDTKRRPKFVAPHQPRLDWQMWFAALNDYRHNPWLVGFCVCLLQGSPEVLSLLERNPFPDAPPRYLRAMVYEYHFTDFATRRKTGAWWSRELKGEYLPVLSLRETR